MHVDAAVYQADGPTIEGLSGEDFRLFDNGEERRVVQCSRGEVPLDVILPFDASGSMHG